MIERIARRTVIRALTAACAQWSGAARGLSRIAG
jgi:hypothetical protein